MIEILKGGEIFGCIENSKFYIFTAGNFKPSDDLSELLDILPEGDDLDILKANFLCDEIELFGLLKNTIGDFDFICNDIYKQRLKPFAQGLGIKFDKLGRAVWHFNESVKISDESSELRVARILSPKLSDFKESEQTYPCELEKSIKVPECYMSLKANLRLESQIFSLSGNQHKLQAVIKNDELCLEYGDMILKPPNPKYPFLAINEHLHTSFLRECGFEVPFNAVLWCDEQKDYAFVINRFDIDKNAKKLPQITLNALMKSPDKYAGSLKEIAQFLASRLEESQKIAFVRYLFINALLYNADLHKKNISFIEREIEGKKVLLLSPAYDIINIASIKGIKPFACAFSINGRQRKIRIKDFESVFKALDLACDESVLADIASVYEQKYPLYLEGLKCFSHFDGRFYKQCFRLYYDNMRHLKNF